MVQYKPTHTASFNKTIQHANLSLHGLADSVVSQHDGVTDVSKLYVTQCCLSCVGCTLPPKGLFPLLRKHPSVGQSVANRDHVLDSVVSNYVDMNMLKTG